MNCCPFNTIETTTASGFEAGGLVTIAIVSFTSVTGFVSKTENLRVLLQAPY
jgi:hypothetical protein